MYWRSGWREAMATYFTTDKGLDEHYRYNAQVLSGQTIALESQLERPHPILGAVVALIAPIALAAAFTPADIAFVVVLGIKSCIAMAVLFPCVFFAWTALPALLRGLWIFPVMGAVVAAIGMFLQVWFDNQSLEGDLWFLLVWTFFGAVTGGLYALCVDGDDPIEDVV